MERQKYGDQKNKTLTLFKHNVHKILQYSHVYLRIFMHSDFRYV